jgi:hypothetical protein
MLSRSREGGEWDFESEFMSPGATHTVNRARVHLLAVGWTAFVEAGAFGSSCFNENLYAPNVFSGLKVSRDHVRFYCRQLRRCIAHSRLHPGIVIVWWLRPNTIEAPAPVQLFLGVEINGATLTGRLRSVVWFPWDDPAEDSWVATEVTVSATADSMTIFIRGYHPLAEQGGKTVVDTMSALPIWGLSDQL